MLPNLAGLHSIDAPKRKSADTRTTDTPPVFWHPRFDEWKTHLNGDIPPPTGDASVQARWFIRPPGMWALTTHPSGVAGFGETFHIISKVCKLGADHEADKWEMQPWLMITKSHALHRHPEPDVKGMGLYALQPFHAARKQRANEVGTGRAADTIGYYGGAILAVYDNGREGAERDVLTRLTSVANAESVTEPIASSERQGRARRALLQMKVPDGHPARTSAAAAGGRGSELWCVVDAGTATEVDAETVLPGMQFMNAPRGIGKHFARSHRSPSSSSTSSASGEHSSDDLPDAPAQPNVVFNDQGRFVAARTIPPIHETGKARAGRMRRAGAEHLGAVLDTIRAVTFDAIAPSELLVSYGTPYWNAYSGRTSPPALPRGDGGNGGDALTIAMTACGLSTR